MNVMKKYSIDLGEIKHKEKHSFKITLDKDIMKATPACGCTDVQYIGRVLSGAYNALELTKDYIKSPLFDNGYLEIQKNIKVDHVGEESSIVTLNAKIVL